MGKGRRLKGAEDFGDSLSLWERVVERACRVLSPLPQPFSLYTPTGEGSHTKQNDKWKMFRHHVHHEAISSHRIFHDHSIRRLHRIQIGGVAIISQHQPPGRSISRPDYKHQPPSKT